ncbi:MAG: LLM class flavin-dependent oxidoreductase [Actinomyces sp.]|nr:MAG: LLM class flavin-dependent oxidoreductase [Actinomyces sp.]
MWVGALGPRLTRAMAGIADGVIVHPFVTAEVVRDHTLVRLAEGLESSGRHRSDLTLVVGAIVATSSDEETLERATRAARANVAFYASTPAYRLTLDQHGLGDLQPRLRELTRRGDWARLADLVDDEVLDLVAVRGTPAEAAAELHRRYGAVADRLALTVAPPTRDEDLAALTAAWRTPAPAPRGRLDGAGPT